MNINEEFFIPPIEWLKEKVKEGLYRVEKDNVSTDMAKLNNVIVYYLSNDLNFPSFKQGSFSYTKRYHKEELLASIEDFNNLRSGNKGFEYGEIICENIHLLEENQTQKTRFFYYDYLTYNKMSEVETDSELSSVTYFIPDEEVVAFGIELKPHEIFFHNGVKSLESYNHSFFHYPDMCSFYEEEGVVKKRFTYKDMSNLEEKKNFIEEQVKNKICFTEKEYDLFQLNFGGK